MLSHAPSQIPAASKPRLSSRRRSSRLGAKHLTATAAAASTLRSVSASRRGFVLFVPSLAAASAVLRPLPSAATEADDTESPAPHPPPTEESLSPQPAADAAETKPEASESAMSRVYDATVLGEPEALAGDARGRVWEKLAAARVVYLGEAELEPDPDDRVVELEIVRGLAGRCADAGRGLALALEAFPCDLQQQLDQFMDGRCGAALRLRLQFITSPICSNFKATLLRWKKIAMICEPDMINWRPLGGLLCSLHMFNLYMSPIGPGIHFVPPLPNNCNKHKLYAASLIVWSFIMKKRHLMVC